MASSLLYKPILIEKLWIPNFIRFGESIRPRIKKKGFKALSLTSGTEEDEVPEIQSLLQSRLVDKKKDICLWAYTHHKKLRLEVYGARVLGSSRYDYTILNNKAAISGEFPYGVLNLDMASQDPPSEKGRIERELESVEATFQLQAHNPANKVIGFVLAYTTLIDEKPIDVFSLIKRLNVHHEDGWAGLKPGDFEPVADTPEAKIELTQRVFAVLMPKYGFETLGLERLTLGNIHSIVVGVGRSVS